VFNNISKSKNCLPTEEGLASYCQDFTGDNGQASLFKHAAEYTVTDIALNGSLIDATDYLQSIGFSKPLAWQRAIRHKFGWVDTSKPGDIMKPSMYFYHQQFVKKLTREQKYCLYVGKIRVDELKNYPSYQGLIPLEKLTQFFNFQNN
jgi:hypothetical protein